MISAQKHQILAPAGGYWRNFVNTDVSIISNQIHLYGASFMISIRRLYHSINWFTFFPFTLEIRSLYHCINWKSGLRPRPSPYPFMFTLDIRCLYHCINWRSDTRGLIPASLSIYAWHTMLIPVHKLEFSVSGRAPWLFTLRIRRAYHCCNSPSDLECAAWPFMLDIRLLYSSIIQVVLECSVRHLPRYKVQ